MALEGAALARQELILDLCENDELRARFDEDPTFAAEERARRGVLPLAVETPTDAPEVGGIAAGVSGRGRGMPVPDAAVHYARESKAQPMRAN
jgi:hypothetical protein